MGNLTVNVAGLTKLGCTVVDTVSHRNCLTHLYLSSARLVPDQADHAQERLKQIPRRVESPPQGSLLYLVVC